MVTSKEEFYRKVGYRLEEYFKTTGLTKKEFAEKLDVQNTHLNRYFIGESNPVNLFDKLYEIGCDIDYLISGKKGREYIPIHEAERNHFNEDKTYKIVGVIPAGVAEVTDHDWYETATLEYNPEDHAFIAVDEEFGFSMMPSINPGDLVLISFSAKIKNGDLVAARWDATKGALKIYSDNPEIPGMAVLTSYNQAVAPIFVSKEKAKLYKVVLIKKGK